MRLHVSYHGELMRLRRQSQTGVSMGVRCALGEMDETWTLEIRSGKRGSQARDGRCVGCVSEETNARPLLPC